jgi:hypothetical protein
VNQPRELFQILRAKDAELGSVAGWFGSLGWHMVMLQEAGAGESTASTSSRLAPSGRARAPVPTHPFASRQREGYEGIAQGFFGDLGMTAGGDHHILFSVGGEAVGHRGRVSAVRQLRLP